MSKIISGVKILKNEGMRGIYQRILIKKKNKEAEQKRLQEFRKIHLISDQEREWEKEYVFCNPQKISILTPLYNTPKDYLIDLLNSLQKQTYSNWELCLADGSDKDHEYVGKICRQYADKDSRILYQPLQDNKGISENTNACLEFSSGAYIGLLDHDDVLHESALFEVMRAIEKNGADFLYTDEVKFTDKIENAVDFNLKPGFGKDELRSHNYICHFTVFSRELLNQAGGVYRAEFDGSQDHDMVLRLTEKAKKIVHVQKVLYYWRVHPESVSMNLDAKGYAVDAAIRAVSEQLERTGEYGTVESNLPYQTIYRVRYALKNKGKVAILIHHTDSEEQYDRVCKMIEERSSYKNYQTSRVCEKEGESFASACNRAAKMQHDAEYLLFMDSHILPVCESWIEELMMFAQREDVCGVSPKVLYENHTIAYAGISVANCGDKVKFLEQNINDDEQGYEAMLRHVRNTTSIWKGCCMLSKRSWENLNGFSEDMRGYEDVDISLRGRRCGLWNVWTCFSIVLYSKQNITDFMEGDTNAFEKKWNESIVSGDEYCHPLLEKMGIL